MNNINDIVLNLNLGFLIIIQIALFIRSVNIITRDITHFFLSIKNEDSSIVYSKKNKSRSLDRLYQCFDEINNSIRDIKILNASQYQYFKIVTENIATGLISFREDGTIELFNKAVSKLLGINNPKNLDDLSIIDIKLPEIIKDNQSGEKKLLKLFINNELNQISLETTELKILDKNIKIVTLQNIKNELENNELDSWQKLIRVLNHEIINSTGPISSAASTLKDKYFDETNKVSISSEKIDEVIIEDTIEGLTIIEDRSDGLAGFVKKYRELTALSLPIISSINIRELFKSMSLLFKDKLKREKISLVCEADSESFYVEADKNMIDQVLINLLNNSMQALQESKNGKILLKGYIDRENNKLIEISDNGIGISKQKLERVFVPFYTTKKEGTGIGLSLSRQIMRLHAGTISVQSKEGEGSTFILRF